MNKKSREPFQRFSKKGRITSSGSFNAGGSRKAIHSGRSETAPHYNQKKRQITHDIFQAGSRLVRFAQLPFIIGAIIIFLFILGETLTMDWRLSFVYNRGKESISENVVIAAIDEETVYYDSFRRGRNYIPLDRSFLDSLINAIEEYQPAVVGLDILLEAPSENLDADSRLSRTLEANPNIVIGSSLYAPTGGAPLEFVPHPLFTHANTLTGFANITGMGARSGTTKMRQYRLMERASGEYIPSFAYAVFLGYMHSQKNTGGNLSQLSLRSGIQGEQGAQAPVNLKTDFDPREEYFVNYSADTPLVVSAHQIFHRLVNPASLRGKIVLVGASSEKFNDNFDTSVGRLPGVMIHGRIVSNLLDGQLLRHPSASMQALFAGIYFFLTMVIMRRKGVYGGLKYIWIFLIAYYAGVFILFWIYPTLWLPLNSPSLFVIALTFAVFALDHLYPDWQEYGRKFAVNLRLHLFRRKREKKITDS